jgi:CubicO group peptidase (beta-lactamase class C family)
MTCLSIALLVTCTLSARAPQTPPLADRIEAYMVPLVADRVFSGTLLIGTPEAVLFAGAFGEADVARGVANEIDTRFRIASITKTFTSAAVAILADLEVLDLDDTIDEYLPEFPGGEQISIRDLLMHRSGLANPVYAGQFSGALSLSELVAHIGARAPLFAPGARNQYSNAGYNLLARIIEQAAEQPYELVLQDLLFEPLEMTSTAAVPALEEVSKHAAGYLPGPPPIGVTPITPYDLGYYTGSGSLSSTVNDLYLWARAIHGKTLFDIQKQPWPFGWGRLSEGGVSQEGSMAGFASTLAVFDDPGLFVVTLQNVNHADWTRWATDLAAIAQGKSVETPKRLTRYEPKSIDAYAGHYSSQRDQIEILAHDGHLWLKWSEWSIDAYLAPTSRNVFSALEHGGAIRFELLSGELSPYFVWSFGDDDTGTIYSRDESGK